MPVPGMKYFHMIVEADAGKAIHVGRGEVDPAHPRVEVLDPRDRQGAATKFVPDPADLVAYADTFAAVFHTIVSAIAGSVGVLGGMGLSLLRTKYDRLVDRAEQGCA